jgi:hypothetical protein
MEYFQPENPQHPHVFLNVFQHYIQCLQSSMF